MRKFRLKKVTAMFLSALLLALMAAGCAPATPSNPPATPPSGGTPETPPAVDPEKMFNIVLTAPFTGFDPLKTNDSASTYINAQIYETLYLIGPEDDFICLLAEELPVFSEDGKTATVKLREGIKFHDGTPFNAEAVKYTFDLIKNPEFGSARASLAASMESIEAVDEYTVRFNLLYEDGVLTAKLAHTNSAIVSPAAQAAQDLMVDPVGTGPYKFVSSVSGSNVVLVRNEEYWGEIPDIKNVTMTIITEASTAIARMETGEADFMPNLPVEHIPRAESIPNVTVGTSSAAQIYYVPLRATSFVNPLMANLDFRIAICKAIDNVGYTEFVMENYATPARSVIGPKVFGYTPEAETYGYEYDPEGAKAMVEENGWGDEVIKFLVPATPDYTKMGEYVQANLKAAGFNNVQIESIDWSAWLTESKIDNRFDISLAAWSNVTRDGTELLEPNWETKVSAQRNRANDPEFDKLVYESKTTADKAVRIEKLDAANKILLEKAYVKPMYNAENLFCYNSAYEGVTRDAGGTFRINAFKIK